MFSLSHHGTAAAGPITVALREEIAQELVDIACSVANTQIDRFTTGLVLALQQSSTHCRDAKQAKLHENAATLLKKNRYPFYYVVSARLASLLRYEMQAALYPTVQLGDNSDVPPSLSADIEVDKKLALIRASRAIEIEHTGRLNSVAGRIANLFDRPEMTNAHSPFRPHVFLSAVHDAWCEFQPDTNCHHLVFPLLGPALCFDMAPILHAVNVALIKRGVGPLDLHAESASGDDVHGRAKVEDEFLIRRLRKHLPAPIDLGDEQIGADGFPPLLDADAVRSDVARSALLAYLARLPHDAPPPTGAEICEQVPGGSVTPADSTVIALIEHVFNHIRNEEHISTELRDLLLSLQLPLLKSALCDWDFFFKRTHPPRRAIELLLTHSPGWEPHRSHTDPLYLLLARHAQRVREESARRPSVFAEVAVDLEAYGKREDTAGGQILAQAIQATQQREKQLLAEQAAEHEVALRVGTGEVVAFVETMLEQRWVSVLTLAYSIKSHKPQAVEHALHTMDGLIWSVKPKITPEERKDLIARLPGIIAALNKWLDLIKWDDQERANFFDELARCHASIVRAPIELSPERQVQLAIAAAKHAAERRLARQARAKPAAPFDQFTVAADEIERGAWVAFTEPDGNVTKWRLAWTSPSRSLYLFSTRERTETRTLLPEEFAQALRERRAQIVLGAGLVRHSLMTALGANDSTITEAAAA